MLKLNWLEFIEKLVVALRLCKKRFKILQECGFVMVFEKNLPLVFEGNEQIMIIVLA